MSAVVNASDEAKKEALRAVIEKQKLMPQTLKNLAWWGDTWESATPFNIRKNAVDAMFFALRFKKDEERAKYVEAESKFIEALNKACGIKLIKLRVENRGFTHGGKWGNK